jgi:hypothetical protein
MDILKAEQPIEKTESPQPIGALGAGKDLELVPLERYFGTEGDPKAESQLKYIYDLFKNDVRTIPEMLMHVRSIEQRLGVVPMGQTRLGQVYQYLRIQGQISELINEQKSMEKYGG